MAGFQFKTEGITLTKSELKIIDYIYKNIAYVPYYSIGQLAEKLDISVATLSRFVRHLGYENYKDLKEAILKGENASPANKLNSTLSNPNLETISQLFMQEIDCILKTKENLSATDVQKAVNSIAKASTVYVFGKGAHKALAEYFSFRLNRFQKHTKVMKSSGSELFEDLNNIKTEDLVILFGFEKIPVEARIILDYKKAGNYTTLLFTDKLYTDSNQLGDINLYVYRGESKEYHSIAATAVYIDCLIIQVAKLLKDASIKNLSDLYELKEKYKNEIPR